MRAIVFALGAAAAISAGAAFAQYPDYRYDPNDWAARQRAYDEWRWQHRDDDRWRDERWRDQALNGDWECWNPHAGHFEGVRPGERQDDLDYARCRPKGGALQPYPGYNGYYGRR